LKKPIVEEVYMDSVVYHGDKKSYLEDRFYKVENYFHGVFKEVEYFNDQGKVISEKEFRNHDHRNTRGPDIQTVFLIKRSKKSKKKSKGKKE